MDLLGTLGKVGQGPHHESAVALATQLSVVGNDIEKISQNPETMQVFHGGEQKHRNS